jgi:hypothetical protein
MRYKGSDKKKPFLRLALLMTPGSHDDLCPIAMRLHLLCAVQPAATSIHSSNGVQASKLHINFSVRASLVMLNCDQTIQLHATCILLQHVLVGLIGCSLQAADAPLTLSTPHIQL